MQQPSLINFTSNISCNAVTKSNQNKFWAFQALQQSSLINFSSISSIAATELDFTSNIWSIKTTITHQNNFDHFMHCSNQVWPASLQTFQALQLSSLINFILNISSIVHVTIQSDQLYFGHFQHYSNQVSLTSFQSFWA